MQTQAPTRHPKRKPPLTICASGALRPQSLRLRSSSACSSLREGQGVSHRYCMPGKRQMQALHHWAVRLVPTTACPHKLHPWQQQQAKVQEGGA